MSKIIAHRHNKPALVFLYYEERTLPLFGKNVRLPAGYYFQGRKHLYKIMLDNCEYKPVWVGVVFESTNGSISIGTVEAELRITSLDFSNGTYTFKK